MLGLNRKNVKLSKYHLGWKKAFEDEKTAIQEKLGEAVLDVEHIGSTSIPGMIAKPVLDFLVAIPSIDDYEQFIVPLKELGYEFRRDNRQSQDHILFVKGPEDLRTHYLKLTEKDTEFWKEHILFRDYLINHPDAAKKYKQLKETLQKSHISSRATYTEAKAEFIQRIIELANNNNVTDPSWYRVTVDGVGIYEAVDRDCPRDSDCRKNKPDGGWLPKEGPKYPSAISYWSEYGWKKYQESGLFDWHKSVVKGTVEVEKCEDKPESILYEDEYQIIVKK
jgi:GrpB-like predicted nucleotidyltransferase (UPF0157 family)